MLRILDIALAYPSRRESLDSVAKALHLTGDQTRMYERFFGFGTFRCDHAQPLQSLLGEATDAVLCRNPERNKRLSYVVHCHTLPCTDVFAERSSSVLLPFLRRGLEVFSGTMNHCATGISMLGVLGRMLGEGETGLILVGEKAFHPALRVIENTTIMGEAAAAVLVGNEPGPYEVVDTYTRHDARFWRNTGSPGEAYLEGFEEAYLDFACTGLSCAMEKFGVGVDDIRWVLPHNVNVPSWLRIAQQLGLAKDKLYLSTIRRFGHCFGADPFINLSCAAAEGSIKRSDRALLFSVGLGATASCALLRVT